MEIDARDFKCPKPVVLTLEALPKLKDGESLDILVNDNVALSNLMRLAASKKLDFYANQQGADTAIKLVPRADSKSALLPQRRRHRPYAMCLRLLLHLRSSRSIRTRWDVATRSLATS